MTTIVQANDGLRSMTGALGDPSRDKAAGLSFTNIHLSDAQICAAFESNWISRKLVMIPAQDATRKWRNYTGEQSKEIREAEFKHDVRGKVFEGLWKARLWGEGYIYLGIDGQESRDPLDLESIKENSLTHLPVLSCHDLQPTEIERDIESPLFNKPKMYRITSTESSNRDIGSDEIHPSRLAIFHGDAKADAYRYPSGSGYTTSQSVLRAAYETLLHAGGVFSGAASLMLEANIDVVGIPDLMAKLSKKSYESALIERFAIAAANKGINGMMILDSNETFHRRSASFANIDSIIQEFALFCAAAADIPATRFLGQTPSGLQSTGESDMRNYHDKIESMQSTVIQPALYNLDQCLIRSTFGSVPEDLSYVWAPLKQMDEKELAEIEKDRAEVIAKIGDVQAMPLQAVYEMLKGWGKFENTDIDTFQDYEKSVQIEEQV